ncbi:MAG: response regulator [Desulfuromonadaceae bacterium]|nr:response regulator [Desulfuromonadaceae bacterium]MDD2856158.1 response regulator [Desulfuromonadaceae bacterium]
MNKKTVLVVDDEPLSVEILCNLLEDDYNIVKAGSGREALEIMKRLTPDIILLDLVMGDMDGYEAYSAIRKIPKFDGTPVLFITALADVECEAIGLEMGVNDYIHKPFSPDLVRLRIKNHLAFSQQRSLLLQRSEELQAINANLEAALSQVRRLEGLIPICSYCHKIRDDKAIWYQLEEYISDHSEARFTHGICPDCMKGQLNVITKIE